MICPVVSHSLTWFAVVCDNSTMYNKLGGNKGTVFGFPS